MKILLDSHILLWLLSDDPLLSKKARKVISDEKNEIYFSSVSLAEIGLKHQLKPELMPFDPAEIRQNALDSNLQEMDFKGPQAVAFGTLPLHHRDPFDRMLIAQAKVEGAKLLTHDHLIELYGPVALMC